MLRQAAAALQVAPVQQSQPDALAGAVADGADALSGNGGQQADVQGVVNVDVVAEGTCQIQGGHIAGLQAVFGQ